MAAAGRPRFVRPPGQRAHGSAVAVPTAGTGRRRRRRRRGSSYLD